MRRIFWGFLVLILGGCASSKVIQLPEVPSTSVDCSISYLGIDTKDPLEVLKGLGELSAQSCDREFLALAQIVRDRYRDKVYEVSKEGSEFLASDGVSTDYVLEGYERTYLSVLMALGETRLHHRELAQVELRRAYEEQKARIYNESEDPVTQALQAVLWENTGDTPESRVHWKRLAENPRADETSRRFALRQINRIDEGRRDSRAWTIQPMGSFPIVDWHFTSFDLTHSYYNIAPASSFPMSYSDGEDLVRISTQPWFREIQDRYSVDRHPLTFAKTLTRGVVGVGFGAVTGTLGLGLGLGGCALAKDNADACGLALKAGFALASLGFTLTESYLTPDLRRWPNVPAAIVLRREPAIAPAASAAMGLTRNP